MKHIIKKLQEEIAYAKDRMLTYEENNQKSNSDVEMGKAMGLNMALDMIKEEDNLADKKLEELDADSLKNL